MRGRGRRWLGTILLAAIFGAGASLPAYAKVTRVKPSSHAGAVRVLLGKKTNLYHKATRAKPAVYEIAGPTRVRILARSLAPSVGSRKQAVHVELDGKPAKGLTLPITVSGKAALRRGGKVGVMRERILDLPSGTHRLCIQPGGAAGAVAVRLYRGVPSKATRWIPYSPQSFARAVRVRSGDREETWYRQTADTPVGMTVHGPLRMRVSTRLDFDLNAGTTQSYVVRVLLDGKPLESFSLKSQASHTTTYPDLPEITPGMPREFSVSVPGGTHRVEFQLEGTTAPAASLRILVPQTDLKKQTRAATPKVNGKGRT
jgi:hypothetical protein